MKDELNEHRYKRLRQRRAREVGGKWGKVAARKPQMENLSEEKDNYSK